MLFARCIVCACMCVCVSMGVCVCLFLHALSAISELLFGLRCLLHYQIFILPGITRSQQDIDMLDALFHYL